MDDHNTYLLYIFFADLWEDTLKEHPEYTEGICAWQFYKRVLTFDNNNNNKNKEK